MNQPFWLIIWRKILDEQDLNQKEIKYVESLLPNQEQGYVIHAFVKSADCRKRHFMHIFNTPFDANQFYEEQQNSLSLSQQLGRYFTKIVKNLVFSNIRGKKVQQIRKIIDQQMKIKPICTTSFTLNDITIEQILKHKYEIQLHWEIEREKILILNNPVPILSNRNKMKNQVEVMTQAQYIQKKIKQQKEEENDDLIMITPIKKPILNTLSESDILILDL